MKYLALTVLLIGIATANAFTAEQIQFQKSALQHHNTLRAEHCVGPLELDDELNDIAQNYADYLAYYNLFEHSNNGYGENLYWSSSSVAISSLAGTEATQDWYDEIYDYDFNRPGFSSATGHFTQVVWRDTERLGIGLAFGSGRRTMIVVANYDPPGNYMGQFNANVPRPC